MGVGGMECRWGRRDVFVLCCTKKENLKKLVIEKKAKMIFSGLWVTGLKTDNTFSVSVTYNFYTL